MPREDVSTNSVHDQRNYEFPQFSPPDERDHSEIMNMILTPPSPYQDFEMQQQGEDETANPNEFEANDISPSPASSINSSQNSPNSFDDVGSSLPEMADDGTPSPSASAETVVPPARSVESEDEHEQGGSPQHESNNSQDEIEDEEASSNDRDTASHAPTQPTHDIGDGAESGSQRSLSGVEESINGRMASSNENSSPNQAPEDDIANESAEDSGSGPAPSDNHSGSPNASNPSSTSSSSSSDTSTSSPSTSSSSSSSVAFESTELVEKLKNATCMRVRGNAGSFVAGVLKHLTKCVLCSMSNVVNSVTEHDVKAALRANADLKFLTKNCLMNIVQMASDDDI